MENYTVYEHINLINNKRYIGITKQDPYARWANGHGYSRNKSFFEDIMLYGWTTGFKHNILFSNLTRQEAFEKEIELIEKYDLTNPEKGYNKSKGGETGPGDFTLMTEWARTHKRFGKDNTLSKKVQCIETGDVFGSISEANRWANTTKISDYLHHKRDHAGTHPKTNQLLTWRYADDDAEVTIICNENKRKNKIKKVMCIDTGEIFNNASHASRCSQITACNILRVCKGERKTAGGMRWCFYNEEGE